MENLAAIARLLFCCRFTIKAFHNHRLYSVYSDKRNKNLERKNNKPNRKFLVIVFYDWKKTGKQLSLSRVSFHKNKKANLKKTEQTKNHGIEQGFNDTTL